MASTRMIIFNLKKKWQPKKPMKPNILNLTICPDLEMNKSEELAGDEVNPADEGLS